MRKFHGYSVDCNAIKGTRRYPDPAGNYECLSRYIIRYFRHAASEHILPDQENRSDRNFVEFKLPCLSRFPFSLVSLLSLFSFKSRRAQGTVASLLVLQIGIRFHSRQYCLCTIFLDKLVNKHVGRVDRQKGISFEVNDFFQLAIDTTFYSDIFLLIHNFINKFSFFATSSFTSSITEY